MLVDMIKHLELSKFLEINDNLHPIRLLLINVLLYVYDTYMRVY